LDDGGQCDVAVSWNHPSLFDTNYLFYTILW
jgi:hypothetical protein